MIHQYKLGDLNIVIDVFSGSVHVVDEIAYEIIAEFEKHTRDEIIDKVYDKFGYVNEITKNDIAECYDQVLELKASGKLFTEDSFEPLAGELKERYERFRKLYQQ